MKHLIVMVILIVASCAIPSAGTGDNAPDVETTAPPDAAGELVTKGWGIPRCPIPWMCTPDAGAPDARPPTPPDAGLPPYWRDVSLDYCERICQRFQDYAAGVPGFDWCAPTYTQCYTPCVSDGDHVPVACWDQYYSWLRDEWNEGPDRCDSPDTRAAPYAYWAEAERDAYNQCWQQRVQETR